MCNTISINDIEKVGRNLYKHNGIYYRLFAQGVTSNGCWLINPIMKELLDIDVSTGLDVYGQKTLNFDGVTGTVSSYTEFVTF